MKKFTLYIAMLNAMFMNCAMAQLIPEIKLPEIKIPEIKIPEIGVRTDGVRTDGVRTDAVKVPEVEKVFSELDRIRLEAGAQANAPILAAWLQKSRNDAIRGASPIPTHIRKEFVGFFDDDVLNRARYKVGDGGAVNLGNLSLTYGDQAAIVLIDTIVFSSASDVQNNLALWAHELHHVKQYRDWGVRDFAIRYLRSWNSVEDDAEAAATNFENFSNQRMTRQSTGPANTGPIVPVGGGQQMPASMCTTPFGACPMGIAIPRGSQCYCPTFQGPVWGQAQ